MSIIVLAIAIYLIIGPASRILEPYKLVTGMGIAPPPAGAAAGLAQVQQRRSRPSCLTSLRFSGSCLDPAGGQPSLWHVCLPRRDACEPWQACSQCLGSGAGSKSRFRSMAECRHVCVAAGEVPSWCLESNRFAECS
ncbi:unnamed protein product [Ixodes pacificus]